MHQIANKLPEMDCWFSQVFTDSQLLNKIINKTSWANGTALAGQFRLNSEKYMLKHGLQTDYGATQNEYDLVVYCSDMLIPERMLQYKTIWVQEGMIDKFTLLSRLVKSLELPAAFAGNTSLNGSTNLCDIYCAASTGYKEYFANMGTDKDKIIVTGIPNYDDLEKYLVNDFPHRNYVMVATTDMRETYRVENRPAFIKKAVKIATGRPMLFKLHPNENFERAKREIRNYAPAGSMIFTSGNTNEMIANCCELITQYSTVVFTGIALGKKVHSWFDVDELKKLTPLQNGGMSAQNIAAICREYINHTGGKDSFDPHAVTMKQPEPEFAEELLSA